MIQKSLIIKKLSTLAINSNCVIFGIIPKYCFSDSADVSQKPIFERKKDNAKLGFGTGFERSQYKREDDSQNTKSFYDERDDYAQS